jgi:cell division protein FtsL
MAARIIERIIMIIFITLTVLFAFFMLGDAGEDIRLNDEIMDKVKK